MTSRDFCYWLQGFLELSKQNLDEPPLERWQFDKIQAHLAMVFKHEIDSTFGGKPEQDALNQIHNSDTLYRC